MTSVSLRAIGKYGQKLISSAPKVPPRSPSGQNNPKGVSVPSHRTGALWQTSKNGSARPEQSIWPTCAFMASHAIGQGSVIWVFIAELFPTHLRASGQAFGSSVHWVLAAAIPSFIPVLFSSIGAEFVFVVFALMMVGQLIWTHFFMPETKGVSLEELSRDMSS